jgi:hypothetical protein
MYNVTFNPAIKYGNAAIIVSIQSTPFLKEVKKNIAREHAIF